MTCIVTTSGFAYNGVMLTDNAENHGMAHGIGVSNSDWKKNQCQTLGHEIWKRCSLEKVNHNYVKGFVNSCLSRRIEQTI